MARAAANDTFADTFGFAEFIIAIPGAQIAHWPNTGSSRFDSEQWRTAGANNLAFLRGFA
jgi:hypothetical protein